ncbi:MAG: hypothetical protein K0S20_248 [Patescibacteria group bacterium]|nr:hypothetical protein [Patescibacteria group bacterium]
MKKNEQELYTRLTPIIQAMGGTATAERLHSAQRCCVHVVPGSGSSPKYCRPAEHIRFTIPFPESEKASLVLGRCDQETGTMHAWIEGISNPESILEDLGTLEKTTNGTFSKLKTAELSDDLFQDVIAKIKQAYNQERT